MYELGVIGAGHMGMAILESGIAAGFIKPAEALAYDVSAERMKALKDKGFAAAAGTREVYEQSKQVLLAVLPQHCESVLESMKSERVTHPPVILSIVSGLSSACIRKYLGENTPVINIVPNLTILSGLGATAMSRTDNVPDGVFDETVRFYEEMGEVAVVAEPLLKEIIPVNGCAPGYVFYIIDAMAKAMAGIDYQDAVRLAAASFAGSAQMLLNGDASPTERLGQVCSPGGLTAAGVEYFNRFKLDEIIAGGMWASADRGRELAR